EGRSTGTIATYVGDARRFVEWFAGGRRTLAWFPKGSTRRAYRRRVGLLRPIPVPASLRKAADEWIRAGRPRQRPISWPRQRWEVAFPEKISLLRSLPDALDRETARRYGVAASSGPEAARDALLVTLAWGFGGVG